MKIVDLTLPYSETIAGFSSAPARKLDTDGWNASALQIYSHAGTHMDAPLHFGVSDFSIDQFRPEDFMADRAWVVNVADCEEKYLITVEDLRGIAPFFRQGDSLLFKTNWYKRLGTDAYRNALPRISEELAVWCVDNRVKILGVEPPSVADVNNMAEVTLIHKILLGKVIIVEGLCDLDKISGLSVKLIALPLKIKGGDGAPCRVIAIEE
ncbi:cyclase family protein [Persicitalea jodogahamensis]|uniref:Cyclase n=1 Tax=Persicitalea jodogahamensis TaxID=402147 RepID=A0A8J3D449_9BACT|nr:cyclase family protein [Persicitalea jodogahamensis]GHB80206.1 cyclase [Persicitalea jodogahamensis]